MKFISRLKDKGQTSVEYLLLMAVSVGLCLIFAKKFEGYLITNPDSYINVHLNFYKNQFNGQHGYKKFRVAR